MTKSKSIAQPKSHSYKSDFQGPIPPNSIRGLSLAGIALIGLYATIVISSCFPVQLLRPAWQLQVGATLINSSPLALIGLMTLHLTADLEPEDTVLVWRRSLAAQLAVLASVGFLMLILLLPVSAVREQKQQISSSASFVRRATTNLQAMRQVVEKASNTTELHDQLLALSGPVLNDADRALPLPVIKAQINEMLDVAEAQFSHQKQKQPPNNPLLLLPNVLRNAFASFFLAISFSGLSRRPGADISLLMELQQWWYSSRISKSKSRRKNSQAQEDLDYLGQISGEDEVK